MSETRCIDRKFRRKTFENITVYLFSATFADSIFPQPTAVSAQFLRIQAFSRVWLKPPHMRVRARPPPSCCASPRPASRISPRKNTSAAGWPSSRPDRPPRASELDTHRTLRSHTADHAPLRMLCSVLSLAAVLAVALGSGYQFKVREGCF